MQMNEKPQSPQPTFEEQYNKLFEIAKGIYPDINDIVITANNMSAKTTQLNDFLNLTQQQPTEISNNQISF